MSCAVAEDAVQEPEEHELDPRWYHGPDGPNWDELFDEARVEQAIRSSELTAAAELDAVCRPAAAEVLQRFLEDRSGWAADVIEASSSPQYNVVLDGNNHVRDPGGARLKLAWLVACYSPHDNPLTEAQSKRARELGLFDAREGDDKPVVPMDAAFWALDNLLRSARAAADAGLGPGALFPGGYGLEHVKRELDRWRRLVSTDHAKGISETEPAGGGKTPKGRRTRPKGEGQGLCRKEWLEHHEYENGRCFNDSPIASVSELATLAGVTYNTAKKFFDDEFKANRAGGGYALYEKTCWDRDRLNYIGMKIARDPEMIEKVSSDLAEMMTGDSGSARRQVESGANLGNYRRCESSGDDE